MLRRFAARGFKSLRDLEVELRPFSVFLGANAAGKSNLLEALQVFSRTASRRTLGEALHGGLRGFPIEMFSFPPGGFPALFASPSARFEFDADLAMPRGDPYRYEVAVEINCRSGALRAGAERPAPLPADGAPRQLPLIETKEDAVVVRHRGRGRPQRVPRRRPSTTLSDRRFTAPDHEDLERVRDALVGWRAYDPDPRVAMRTARPPTGVRDIGVRGQNLAPYLFRLRHEFPERYDAARRTLRTLVPGIEDLEVELDDTRGEVSLRIRQDGIRHSSRVVSEGALRVVALAVAAVDPWAGSLVAFENPDAGIHPRRLESVADLLLSLTRDGRRQVLVATASPVFCDAVLRRAQTDPETIGLYAVGGRGEATRIRRLDPSGPLFRDPEVRRALASDEEGVFESLFLRGLLDD